MEKYLRTHKKMVRSVLKEQTASEVPYTCLRSDGSVKIGFDTRAAAYRSASGQDNSSDGPLQVYRCQAHIHGWHVGHRRSRKERGVSRTAA